MFGKLEQELPLVNGLYRVKLDGESLEAISRGSLHIYYYGNRAEAAKDQAGLKAEVLVYPEILARSFSEPWYRQLEMIEEENAKMQQRDRSWRITYPQNAATAIGVAREMYKQYGINVLPNYTRVGPGGSLVAGGFDPRGGAGVSGNFLPDGRGSRVGVLPLAVKVGF